MGLNNFEVAVVDEKGCPLLNKIDGDEQADGSLAADDHSLHPVETPGADADPLARLKPGLSR